jgi:IS30 family transposase
LRTYIVCRLKEGWSPEQISGRLRRKKSKYTVCHETIYRYIYKKNNRLYRYLPYKKPKRLRVCARKPQLCRYGDIRIITERPENIDKRIGLGHWEGDRIEFAGTKEHSVTTLVERKTRLLLLIKNETKASTPVMNKICDKFNMAEKMACRSITFDQGSEFAAFPIAENELKCKVYYCHVHSPWEKGSNENMNGRLRRYLPSNINIRDIDQNQLNELERKMNNTPRKCLDYRTPNELFLNQYREFCRTWG